MKHLKVFEAMEKIKVDDEIQLDSINLDTNDGLDYILYNDGQDYGYNVGGAIDIDGGQYRVLEFCKILKYIQNDHTDYNEYYDFNAEYIRLECVMTGDEIMFDETENTEIEEGDIIIIRKKDYKYHIVKPEKSEKEIIDEVLNKHLKDVDIKIKNKISRELIKLLGF